MGNAVTLFTVYSFTLKRGGCIGDVQIKLAAAALLKAPKASVRENTYPAKN
jgi:hypothetical protein